MLSRRGILEELISRGIILKSVESLLTAWLIEPVAAGVAVCIAALGAGVRRILLERQVASLGFPLEKVFITHTFDQFQESIEPPPKSTIV